jgi:hypothetical protein
VGSRHALHRNFAVGMEEGVLCEILEEPQSRSEAAFGAKETLVDGVNRNIGLGRPLICKRTSFTTAHSSVFIHPSPEASILKPNREYI